MPRYLEMPHQGSRISKVPAKYLRPPAKGSLRTPVNGTSFLDYSTLKRTELQQQCKKLGLRATGKNAELVERLKAHHENPVSKTTTVVKAANKTKECCQTPEAPQTVSNSDLPKAVKTEPFEEKTDIVQGWCVVHGMTLYRPSSSWAPLLLCGGLVYVQDGKNRVPFHLPPLNTPVPNGLSDNYVCEDCVARNREKPKSCPLCHKAERKRKQSGSSKRGSRIPIPLQLRTTQASPLQISDTKDRRRTVEIRKLYEPQEDQAYAQRVDGILSQMARGELGMDRVLRPLQPLVVHSPSPLHNFITGLHPVPVFSYEGYILLSKNKKGSNKGTHSPILNLFSQKGVIAGLAVEAEGDLKPLTRNGQLPYNCVIKKLFLKRKNDKPAMGH